MNVKRNSNYLKQTENELKIAAEKAGLSIEEAQELLDDFFKIIRDFLNDERMPSFYVPYLGKFMPTLGSIRRSLRLTFRMLKDGRIIKDIAIYRIKKFWPIRQRLIKERLNIPQYKHWRYIPTDWQKKAIPEDYEKASNWYSKGGKEQYDKERGVWSGRPRGSKTDIDFGNV